MIGALRPGSQLRGSETASDGSFWLDLRADVLEIGDSAMPRGRGHLRERERAVFPSRHTLMVVCCALAGAVVGVVLYRWQPAFWQGMNPLGVLAFASLGAGGGCLLADGG